MRVTARRAAMATLVGAVIMLATGVSHGQAVSVEALVNSLREGGYVLVMRHASSPREVPDKQTANADNVRLPTAAELARKKTFLEDNAQYPRKIMIA